MRVSLSQAKRTQKTQPVAPLARVGLAATGLLVLVASGCDFYGHAYGTQPSEPGLVEDTNSNRPAGNAGAQASAGTSGAPQGLPPALGATVTSPPVACGDNLCTPPLDGLSMFLGGLRSAGLISTTPPTPAACCLDARAGVCGVKPQAGGRCEALPVPDDRCAATDLRRLGRSASSLNRPACCIDGMCGQDQTVIGRGCVENSQVTLLLKSVPFLGSLAKVPPPQRCDAPPPPDAGVLEDAGMLEDGGVPDASGVMTDVPM